MRAYSYLGVWCVLGGVALACSGTSFSSGGSSNAGSGGSGDTSSDGGEAGAQTRAGNSSGGTSNGNGGKGSGGSDVAGTDTGGTTSSGGVAGDVSVGGDLVSAGTTSSGGSAGTGPVAGAAGTAGTNGGPSVDLVCPKNQPSNGGSCKDGLQCTYGTDVRMQCRNTASCSDGKWTVNKAVCPDMHGCQNVVMGKQCDPQAPACALGDTGVFCVCAECGNAACSSQYAWACAGSGGGQACPKVVPNLGQACANVDVKCPYGSCDTGYPVTATCTAGFWNWEQGLCAQPL